MAILSLFLSTNYFTTLMIKETQKLNKDVEKNLIFHICCQIETNKLRSYGYKPEQKRPTNAQIFVQN